MINSIVSEYQSQLWLMEPASLAAFVKRLAGLPVNAVLPNVKIEQRKSKLKVANSVAQIDIRGVLLDTVPGWLRLWGLDVTGYDEIAEQVKEASEREDVTGIMLNVDSPGGMVAGIADAADAIYNVRGGMDVRATIKNLGASAAYWLSSQADYITAADNNTLVGSIGVYTYFIDYTKLEDDSGIKVIVIRSGEHKGMGLDTITENQISSVQEYIDATAANFIDAVSQGRRVEREKIEKLATGQLWIAKKADEIGLIDRVFEGRKQNSSDLDGEIAMKNEQEQIDAQIAENEKKAIEQERQKAVDAERKRAAEIREAFLDDAEFAIKAIAEGWSLQEAQAEYSDILRERLKEQAKAAEKNQSKAEKPAEGTAAIATDGTDDAGGEDFLTEARKISEEKKISMAAAMSQLARKKPQLHAEFKERCKTEGRDFYARAV